MKGKDRKTQFKMELGTLRKVWRYPLLSVGAKCLLLDLLFYAGINNKSFPSQKLLGNDLGFSDRYVRTLLKELIKNGLIAIEKRGFSKSNRYYFNTELYDLNGALSSNVRADNSSAMNSNSVPSQTGIMDPTKESLLERKNDKEIYTSFGSVELHPTGTISNAEK